MQDQDNIEEYVQYWRKKVQDRKNMLKKRKKNLKKHALQCSELLKNEFSVQNVFLIGSLARDYQINENW